MRTYSKTQDFKNRLKLAAIIIAVGSIAMWLTSCEDAEPNDAFKGSWSNATFEVENGTDANKLFQLELSLSAYPYTANVEELLINGVKVDASAAVSSDKINEIKSITITGQEFEIVYEDFGADELNRLIHSEKLRFTLPDGTTGNKEWALFVQD
jgi:hypothetical protein